MRYESPIITVPVIMPSIRRTLNCRFLLAILFVPGANACHPERGEAEVEGSNFLESMPLDPSPLSHDNHFIECIVDFR